MAIEKKFASIQIEARSRSVSSATAQLSMSVNALEELITMLRSRLEPVTLRTPMCASQEDHHPMHDCPLADDIQTYANRVADANDALRSILELLEI